MLAIGKDSKGYSIQLDMKSCLDLLQALDVDDSLRDPPFAEYSILAFFISTNVIKKLATVLKSSPILSVLILIKLRCFRTNSYCENQMTKSALSLLVELHG
ncbi:unnamed protein product [Periconia digitata]|uniref:Uncharacterized protein n=1 Tax=Periconia digitata TaxID=1303443 RepID=A0A9W4U783_9PLEO|nr:unnamed protein product [Periconia digitata]